jgi:hypothetical protein
MGSVYLTELANWCRAEGLRVVEMGGWQHRARSSGGYESGRPWCVMWHHTASTTTPANDASYICNSEDAPLANLLLARDGEVWVCAGGATNTNGKGGPVGFSKGVVPQDSMNTHAVGIEAANNGIGELWPREQIDAYFVLNNMLCRRLGLNPEDCCTHQYYAPDRKIDPATAAAVQGPWQPNSVTSSGSWSLPDIGVEAVIRAGALPPPLPGPDPLPPPTPVEGDEVLVVALDSNGTAWVGNGITRFALDDPAIFDRYVLVWAGRFLNTSGKQIKGWPDVATVDDMVIASLGQT